MSCTRRGAIETPVSREGAFLANNLLFAVFAFVVLLGTVFPLFVEAVNGSSITVGGPFFDTMTMPLVLCLLFLMAVAPVLPWRRASGELLRQRLLWPAVAAVVVLVVCVAAGLRGFWPLVVFTLAGFAGASAVRQLVLLVRRTGWRGFTGRSGGGMVVHLGVVLIAVAFRGQPCVRAPGPAHAGSRQTRHLPGPDDRVPRGQDGQRPGEDLAGGHRGPERARLLPGRRAVCPVQRRRPQPGGALDRGQGHLPDLGQRAEHPQGAGGHRGHRRAARAMALGGRVCHYRWRVLVAMAVQPGPP